MSENLIKKDYLYYADLIADLKEKAGIEEINDPIQYERISKRRKMIPIRDEEGHLCYRSTKYSIEFMNIAREIYIKATGVDGLSWLEEIRKFPKEVDEALKELEKLKKIAILEAPYQKVEITEETRKYVLEHPQQFLDCDSVRIRTGKFYTDEEYEQRRNEVLSHPLPGEEKSGPTLSKKMTRSKHR